MATDDLTDSLNFEFRLCDDPPGLSPEESRRRKGLRRAQSIAAAQANLAAQADGRDPQQVEQAGRRAAARVRDLDSAARKLESAMSDLEHLGESHPAVVLLAHALELVEREEALLAQRRRPS